MFYWLSVKQYLDLTDGLGAGNISSCNTQLNKNRCESCNWRGLRTANGLWKAPNGNIEVLNWRIL
jgi:hypothetical protein